MTRREPARGPRNPHVVDTNVLLVAEGLHAGADTTCTLATVGLIREIKAGGCVIVDTSGRIVQEYSNNLKSTGIQPGVGTAFLKWLHENRGKRRCVQQVTITPRESEGEDYEEFPADPALAAFDRSDRKFVAVVVASGLMPSIAVAIDRGWAIHHEALQQAGVTVRFLCPQHCNPSDTS